jgi:hypothetical protein
MGNVWKQDPPAHGFLLCSGMNKSCMNLESVLVISFIGVKPFLDLTRQFWWISVFFSPRLHLDEIGMRLVERNVGNTSPGISAIT